MKTGCEEIIVGGLSHYEPQADPDDQHATSSVTPIPPSATQNASPIEPHLASQPRVGNEPAQKPAQMQRIQTRTEPPTPNQEIPIPINSLGQTSLQHGVLAVLPRLYRSTLSIINCHRAAPPTIDPPRPPARLPKLPDAEECDATTICEKFSFALLMGFLLLRWMMSAVPVHVNCIVILLLTVFCGLYRH